jgi:ankyrin repeat protein
MSVLRRAVIAALALSISAAGAQERKPAPQPPANAAAAALIDKLADVAQVDTGYSPYVSGDSFAPLNASGRITTILFSPSKPAARSDTLRDLVRLGPAAVPDLVRHLGDKRPTRLTVRHTFGGFGGLFLNESEKDDERHAYTLKVGDLCYVALGQIVNRPYAAVRYQPTAIIFVFTPTRAPKTREKLQKEWGVITPEMHRRSLRKDCEGKGDLHSRSGAFLRLAYYYPEALEEPALQFLTRSWHAYQEAFEFVRGTLYKTADPRKRRELFDAYVRERGPAGRDGIREVLFSDLDSLEANEQKRLFPPLKDFGEEPRRFLIELFEAPPGVKAKDKPDSESPSTSYVSEVIEYGLTYDRSAKIDRAVRDLLRKTSDDAIALACMKRLVGRGYDADLEAYCRRREAAPGAAPRKEFEEFLSKAGWSPLHVAVWRDERERLAELLREKADVNARGKDGRTPLHVAAVEGNAQAIPILISAGADPKIKDAQGHTPVAAASSVGDTKVVRMLVEAGSPVPDLLVAATAGKAEEVARFLRDDKASHAAKDSLGRTALHRAALEGHDAVIRQLLEGGAAVDSADKEGFTPLHFAAALGREEACRLLLGHKAIADQPVPRSGAQPIHLAAANGRVRIVGLMVRNGAKVDAHDAHGGTPLQYAAVRESSPWWSGWSPRRPTSTPRTKTAGVPGNWRCGRDTRRWPPSSSRTARKNPPLRTGDKRGIPSRVPCGQAACFTRSGCGSTDRRVGNSHGCRSGRCACCAANRRGGRGGWCRARRGRGGWPWSAGPATGRRRAPRTGSGAGRGRPRSGRSPAGTRPAPPGSRRSAPGPGCRWPAPSSPGRRGGPRSTDDSVCRGEKSTSASRGSAC